MEVTTTAKSKSQANSADLATYKLRIGNKFLWSLRPSCGSVPGRYWTLLTQRYLSAKLKGNVQTPETQTNQLPAISSQSSISVATFLKFWDASGLTQAPPRKKKSKRKQSKVYIVRSCKNLLHLKIFNVVSPLEETLARIHRVPINYSEHKFRLWQLPIRPLFPQSPLFPSPLLFFYSNPPPPPSNGSWFCVTLFHNSIPGVLFRSITYFVGFVSIVMAAWRLRSLVTRGSDQLESPSSFGHYAHFIFGDLWNLLFYFFPYICNVL